MAIIVGYMKSYIAGWSRLVALVGLLLGNLGASSALADCSAPIQPNGSPSSKSKGLNLIKSSYLVEVSDATLWQPIKGKVQVEIKKVNATSIGDFRVIACFRWRYSDQAKRERDENWIVSGDPISVDGIAANTIRLSIRVPDLYSSDKKAADGRPKTQSTEPTPNERIDRAIPFPFSEGFIPKADLKIIGRDKDNQSIFEKNVEISVTSTRWAFAYTVLSILVAIGLIYLVTGRRNAQTGTSNFLLTIIATSNGRASLSQLQIMIWTLVVCGSIVYVFSISGTFMALSDQVLGLLGISGLAILGAQAGARTGPQQLGKLAAGETFPAKGIKIIAGEHVVAVPELQATDTLQGLINATNQAIQLAGPANGLHQCKAKLAIAPDGYRSTLIMKHDGSKGPIRIEDPSGLIGKLGLLFEVDESDIEVPRAPQWGDLVMSDGEVDVTRLQMLLFTGIIAIMVVIKVGSTYTIPVLPDSLLVLMGISNGLYITNKFLPKS
ncbi:MAG: hypothetical protein HZC25_02880 [Rhodospirillales bacterium]|nr:hypothetical protein [Rhodospirillales bacterium]